MTRNNTYPKVAGIYKLVCNANNKIYVGKANNLHIRLSHHGNSINHKIISRYPIHSAIKKYGWDSFNVEILETIEDFNKNIDKEKILNLESHYIKLLDATNPTIGYNICKFSNDNTGNVLTEAHKLKISLAHRGKPKSKESIEKMRKTKTGVPHPGHSAESLEKMSLSKLGKKRPEFSEEWKNNIGMGHTGLVMSEEAKEKISKAHKGKSKSKEHVEKMRKASTGKKHSEETKKKMSESQKGRKLSEEHRQKLIQANVGRKMSDDAKDKMRKAQTGNSNASGKRSEESKQRMREARLAHLEKQKSII